MTVISNNPLIINPHLFRQNSILTIINHFALTWSLKLADIGVIEPITFTRLLWASVTGYLVFGDEPNIYTIIGGAVVLASVIYIARREREDNNS